MHPRVEQALSVLFPGGVPVSRMSDVQRVADLLTGLLDGAGSIPTETRANGRSSDGAAPDAFLAALWRGASTAELAELSGLKPLAVRTRISRLKARGWKIETSNVASGKPGRPGATHRILAEPKR